MIREQDPLKQGLKLWCHVEIPITGEIREQDPLKQGLKLIPTTNNLFPAEIREQDPLKQGLKPIVAHDVKTAFTFASKIH
ncbi:hypothetical protein DKM28_16100 [Methanosarcina mazei]|uniref:Uncharacterized protein n=1 Tax=Methanosarcina mazei TaxID=2209 RepID=A0A4P8RB35_METMZ|nr:hypothetical protein DKM28_16100 [Methanosarcina mazei]